MKCNIFFSILFLFSIQSIYCQKIILKDDQKTWNVAIAEFKSSGSGSNIEYVKNILPSFFFNQLSEIKNHTLSSDEILLLRKKIVSDQLTPEEKNLSQYKKEYDKAYFSEIAKRREIKKNINTSEKKIEHLQEYKLEKINIASVKDISFSKSDETSSITFDPLDIDNFAADKKFDYIIYGSARQAENIVILDVKFYSSLEKKNIFTASVSNEIGTLFSSLDNVISEMISILLGTTWSKITVNTDSRNSNIYLDEKYIGTGSVSNFITSPGEHILTILGLGQEEKTIPVFLKEKAGNIIDLNIILKEEKITAINTFPQEANVYLDSLWMGTTPFLLNGLAGELIIRKEGFRDTRLLLNDIPENSVEIQLSPDIFKKEEFISKKRDSFYTSLSFFILSVPLPFFLYAITSDYNSAYNDAVTSNKNYDEINRLGRIRNYTYYGYHASLFLTISLFVNTLFKLNDYIKAGDILHDEK